MPVTSAMFWKFDLHTSSHLEALLDKEDVTLAELMDEEDVLQECKAQNRRFVQQIDIIIIFFIFLTCLFSVIPGIMLVTDASFHFIMLL